MTPFNFQQFEIEHAPSSSNIMVAAGAGTGKHILWYLELHIYVIELQML